MRPVLLDRGERQHGDPARGVGAGAGDLLPGHVHPVAFGQRHQGPTFRRAMLYCRVADEKEQPMRLAKTCRAMLAGWGLPLGAAAGPASAQTLDKVSFGTNWVAEAEHGGFYQALADGTYRKYGLDVTIVPGGPSANNRILLPVGKIDFFLSANYAAGLRRRRAERAGHRGRRAVPERPAGLDRASRSGHREIRRFEESDAVRLGGGRGDLLSMAQGRLRFQGFASASPTPSIRSRSSSTEERDAGLRDVGAVRHRARRRNSRPRFSCSPTRAFPTIRR